MHSSRSLMWQLRQHHRRRRDVGRRHRDPLAAALPLRAAGQLPGHRYLSRRDQHHPSASGSRTGAAHHRALRRDQLLCAADGVDLPAAFPVFDDVDLSSLRKGYYGASAMPIEILSEIRERLPNLRLWNFYGQTEMAPLASALGPDEQDAHAGAAGRPVVNVETTILDDNDIPVADRCRRRDRPPQPAFDAGLPRRSGQDGGGVPRRLVPFRRPRLLRRAWPAARRRPQEGHDQNRRRERGQPRGRGGPVPAQRVSRKSRYSASRTRYGWKPWWRRWCPATESP